MKHNEEQKELKMMMEFAERRKIFLDNKWPELNGTLKQVHRAMGIKIKVINNWSTTTKNFILYNLQTNNSNLYFKLRDKTEEELKKYLIDNYIQNCLDSSEIIKHFGQQKLYIIKFYCNTFKE